MTAAAPTAGAATGAPSASHDLKTLVLSRHPGIVIETSEEERAEALVQAGGRRPAAAALRVDGDRRARARPATARACTRPATRPGRSRAIAELQVEAHLRAARLRHATWRSPSSRAPFATCSSASARRAGCRPWCSSRHTVELPAEIEPHVVRYELRFPSRDEYRRAIDGRGRVAAAQPVARRSRSSRATTTTFCAALTGLTLNQARQAIARAAIEDGRLHARRPRARGRAQGPRRCSDDGLLEYFPPADNRFELGGFARLRALARARPRRLQRRGRGAEPAAAARACCSSACRAAASRSPRRSIAREWQLPLLKLDAGRLYDKYVGESEKNFRTRDRHRRVDGAGGAVDRRDREGASRPAGRRRRRRRCRSACSARSSPGCRRRRAPVFVVATANDLSRCRPSCCARAASTRSSSSTCRDADEREQILAHPPRAAPAGSRRRFDLRRAGRARPTASAAPRSSRPSSPRCWARCRRRRRSTPTCCWPRSARPCRCRSRAREDVRALRASARALRPGAMTPASVAAQSALSSA